MKLTTVLSLATLALARPQPHVLDKKFALPWGDWISPSSGVTHTPSIILSQSPSPSPPTSPTPSPSPPSSISPSPSVPPSPFASPTPSASPSPIPAKKLGNAVVSNHCKFPVYLWSVGSTVQPVSPIASNESYIEKYRYDQPTGGIALKISTDANGLYNSAPQTIFAYNVNDQGKVWFDLADLFGDAFKGYSVKLEPSDPKIEWKDGVPVDQLNVSWIDSSADLVLHLCSD